MIPPLAINKSSLCCLLREHPVCSCHNRSTHPPWCGVSAQDIFVILAQVIRAVQDSRLQEEDAVHPLPRQGAPNSVRRWCEHTMSLPLPPSSRFISSSPTAARTIPVMQAAIMGLYTGLEGILFFFFSPLCRVSARSMAFFC